MHIDCSKECSTGINEAEAPKFISSSNFLDLPNEMASINTVLLSNTETWQQLKNGSWRQVLWLSSRNLETVLNEKEIFQWHSNNSTFWFPSPDRQSHHPGTGHRSKQVTEPLRVVSETGQASSLPLPFLAASPHLFTSRACLHLSLHWRMLCLWSGAFISDLK